MNALLPASVWIGISVIAIRPVLAAIEYATIANAFCTLTFLAVLGSIVAAIVQRGLLRATWLGIAVFAVAYFSLALLADGAWNFVAGLIGTSQMGTSVQLARPQLITSYWLAWFYDSVGFPQIWTGGGTRVPAVFLLSASPGSIPNDLDLRALNVCNQIGHCIFTWLAGIAGGVLASLFFRSEVIVAAPAEEPGGE